MGLNVLHSPHAPLDAGWLETDYHTEILEVAMAKKVYDVYIIRVTGNCSYQHPTQKDNG